MAGANPSDSALFQRMRQQADEATYRKAIDDCAAEGVSLEMTHIAIPESITLGLPGRDDDIAQICRCIEAAGKAGLRGLNCAERTRVSVVSVCLIG